MSEPHNVSLVIDRWIAKAENDLVAAQQILKLDQTCPFEVVCFHAQQSAEKFIKAVLLFRGVSFSKTHDLVDLSVSLAEKDSKQFDSGDLAQLSAYSVDSRYPSDLIVDRSEAEEAVKIASQVKRACLAILGRQPVQPYGC